MELMIEAALPYLATRGLTPETAERFMLMYDVRRDAILIPYFDAVGRLVGTAARNLSREPKYEWPRHMQRLLYNIVDATRPHVYLTEGEFDCLTLKQLGHDAVAVPGVNNFKEEWAWLFAGHEVSIVFDSDPPQERTVRGEKRIVRPGQDAAHRVARSLSRVTDGVEIVTLPEGEDVNSMFLTGRIREVTG